MGRKSDGEISLTFGELERSDQSHLLESEVHVRESGHCSYRTCSTHRSWIGWGNQFDLKATVAEIWIEIVSNLFGLFFIMQQKSTRNHTEKLCRESKSNKEFWCSASSIVLDILIKRGAGIKIMTSTGPQEIEGLWHRRVPGFLNINFSILDSRRNGASAQIQSESRFFIITCRSSGFPTFLTIRRFQQQGTAKIEGLCYNWIISDCIMRVLRSSLYYFPTWTRA